MRPSPPHHEQLLHWLAEAAELEHNLLCSYLYALFSLKQEDDEDLTDAELAAVRRWRGTLLSVCIEEMTHLAQVANITVALGGRAHFNRPNLPVAAGYHPGGIVIALARFDRDTLDHMIHIERPAGAGDPDGASFAPLAASASTRDRRPPRLMPSGPRYDTIGEFYAILKDGLAAYSRVHGVEAFRGPAELQFRPEELGHGRLLVVRDLADAAAALDEIVRQGEGGAASGEESHYRLFLDMRDEFDALRARRPAFDPARAVVRNPVMHAPTAADRRQVVAHDALALLDFANSLYNLMLRCLQQLYETPWDAPAARQAICAAAFLSMKAFSRASTELTRFPAVDGEEGRAGVSFAMPRHTEGAITPRDAAAGLKSRGMEIQRAIESLPASAVDRGGFVAGLAALNAQIDAFSAAV